LKWKKILLLSPHPDDGLLGAGATIIRAVQKWKAEIHHLILSDCKENVPKGFDPDTIIEECLKADKLIGVSKTEFKEFPVRYFFQHRQEILQAIYDIAADFDVIITPWEFDRHQDHEVVAKETLRAIKNIPVTVLMYELPVNCWNFPPSFFVQISEKQLDQKIKALSLFKTQSAKRRLYFTKEYWRAQLRLRGGQASVPFAEAFVLYKEIIRQ
jgi:LmbE family N-acetylglucosaminyl deacetylase